MNIGSNLGDRTANIARAVAEISSLGQVEVSSPVESEPWGFQSPHPFLNVGVNLFADLAPMLLLERLQQIERQISPLSHRNPDGSYTDRLVDIDIISASDSPHSSPIILSAHNLSLPHPRMHLRPFVLQPMTEILPDWIHPILNLTPSALLEKLRTNN